MAEVREEVRGLPLWLLREYLRELGAREGAGSDLVGAGWSARLTPMDDYQIGSLRVGQVLLELTGDDGAVARLWLALEKKLMRAGG